MDEKKGGERQRGVGSEIKWTPLMDAVYHRRLREIKRLIESKGDVEARTQSGKTALALAAQRVGPRVRATVLFLIDHAHSDIEATDELGWTPLMQACVFGTPEIVLILLKRGVDLEAKTARGETALILALWRGRKKVVSHLLSAKANVFALRQATSVSDSMTAFELSSRLRNHTCNPYDSRPERQERRGVFSLMAIALNNLAQKVARRDLAMIHMLHGDIWKGIELRDLDYYIDREVRPVCTRKLVDFPERHEDSNFLEGGGGEDEWSYNEVINPEFLLGKCVSVRWEKMHRWYDGIVLKWDSTTRCHMIKYSDLDIRWTRLEDRCFSLIGLKGHHEIPGMIEKLASHDNLPKTAREYNVDKEYNVYTGKIMENKRRKRWEEE